MNCDTCGHVHDRCTAHKRDGTPCTKYPNKGLTVCRMHGGASKAAKEAGARRVAEEKALRIVQADAQKRLAHKSDIAFESPLDQLAHIATEAMAFKDALAARVNALTEIRYTSGERSEQLRSEIVLYERALDRTHKFLAELAKLGYDERRVKLAESQGQLLAQVIHRILADLDLTAAQRQAAPEIAAKHLRLVSGVAQ